MLQEKTDGSMQGRLFGLLNTMYAGIFADGHGDIRTIGRQDSTGVDHDFF